jgi:hypothetical protein
MKILEPENETEGSRDHRERKRSDQDEIRPRFHQNLSGTA